MLSLSSCYPKALKKLRASSFVDSRLGYDSKVEAGSNIVSSTLSRHSYVGYDSTLIHTVYRVVLFYWR